MNTFIVKINNKEYVVETSSYESAIKIACNYYTYNIYSIECRKVISIK